MNQGMARARFRESRGVSEVADIFLSMCNRRSLRRSPSERAGAPTGEFAAPGEDPAGALVGAIADANQGRRLPRGAPGDVAACAITALRRAFSPPHAGEIARAACGA